MINGIFFCKAELERVEVRIETIINIIHRIEYYQRNLGI